MKFKFLSVCFLFNLLAIEAQVHIGPGQTYSTIQLAVNNNAVKPGDTVYLHAGNYAAYQLISNLNGNSTNWITITRFQNDSIEISGGWQFVSCTYLHFTNLNFRANVNFPGRLFSIDNGGSCATQSKFIRVDHCSFSNVTAGSATVAFKFAGVDLFEVSNNTFKDIPACEAMSFNTCHQGLIRGNRFENCLSGGHIKGGSSDITMTQNLFINASKAPWVAYEIGGDTGAAFYCPDDTFEVRDINFFSNIIVNSFRGLALSSAKHCKVINNTFYNCEQATMRFLTTSSLYPILSDNFVENNIFAFGPTAYFNGGVQLKSAVNFSNNIYYSILSSVFNGPYWDAPELDAIKDRNPKNFGATTNMFVDGFKHDFNLIKQSPAIAAGKHQTDPAFDFFGKPFSGTARSIGAIEYDEITREGQLSLSIIQIYPNPVIDRVYIKGIEASESVRVEIIDLQGILVFETSEIAPFLQQGIQISHLKSGLYIIQIKGEQIFELRTIIKI